MVGLQDTEHALEKNPQFKIHDPKGISVQCISLHWLGLCNPLRRALCVCGIMEQVGFMGLGHDL